MRVWYSKQKKNWGKQGYCGPAAVSALCGVTVARACDTINDVMGYKASRKVRGTRAYEVTRAITRLGKVVGRNKIGSRKSDQYVYHAHSGRTTVKRPSVTQVLKQVKRTKAYLVGITGHWIVIKGNKAYDNAHPDGWSIRKPGAKYRKAKVTGVWCVAKNEKDLDEAEIS
jgi:hypothetical protein